MPDTNGRPRWTDVLHQLEIEGERTQSSISSLEKNLTQQITHIEGRLDKLDVTVRAVENRLSTLEQSYLVETKLEAQRSQDLVSMGTFIRYLLLTAAAIGGLLVGLFALFNPT